MRDGRGWHNDPYRHSLAARGIKTRPPSYGKFSETMLMMEGRIPGMSASQMKECESYWIYGQGIKDAISHVSRLEEDLDHGFTGYAIQAIEGMSGFEASEAYESRNQRRSLSRDVLVTMFNDINNSGIARDEGLATARVVSFRMDWGAYNEGFQEGLHDKMLSDDMIEWFSDEIHFRLEEKLTRRG